MTDEIDDQGYYDFTTASEWEIFIARLEEIINEWKLPQMKRGPPLKKDELSNGVWEMKSEKIVFANVEFKITEYNLQLAPVDDVVSPSEEEIEECRSQALDDIMSLENNFPSQTHINTGDDNSNVPSPHPLARWYGLRDFLVLAPGHGHHAISTESKVKVLLSSLYMAINNSNCQIPMFVQIRAPWQYYYMGVCEGKGVRTEFEMVHLLRTPPHCKYLTGLLDLFRSKIGSALSLKPVTVSARFTYILKDWTSSTWTQEPPDFDFLQGETLGVPDLGKLPFGATFDPISELELFATWPHFDEDVVVDSKSYSDFEPSQASMWSVRVSMAEQPSCLLSEYLNEFIHLLASKRTMHDLLGDMMDRTSAGTSNLSTSLNLLTESRVPTISKVIKKARGQRRESFQDGPVHEDILMPILYFLFPDAEDEPKSPYPEVIGNNSNGDSKQNDEQLNGLKSAPVESLVWRLAVVMSHVAHTLGGVKAAAHLWYEFTQEMRFRWEHNIPIPGVAPGFPDYRTCLLHQKLQMLNCCVERKKAREQMARAASVEAHDSESDSEEDEFYDCDAEIEEATEDMNRSGNRRRHKHSLWNQPVGRLTKQGNLRLLKTGEHLYIPVTQDPSPKTEDQIEEDAKVLLELGTDSQGAELRARMMTASLLSDMESFKAANPEAVLEDFIRWYSPRDWVEEDGLDKFGQRRGSLSSRMQIRDNMWQEVWQAAKPVPARRQKRLFDDTREAEKVLHFLESRTPAHISHLLLPVLVHAAICRLILEQKEGLPGLPEALRRIIKRAERLTRNPQPTQRHYEDLLREVVDAEAVIAQANSLEHKFSATESMSQSESFRAFLTALMQTPEVEVPGGPWGPIGCRIRAMFLEAQKVLQMLTEVEPMNPGDDPWSSPSNFPQPTKREFIMRAMAACPAPSCSLTPQRLYATLQRDEFRLAGCFSHDTTFQ